jgi:hypothetical protein
MTTETKMKRASDECAHIISATAILRMAPYLIKRYRKAYTIERGVKAEIHGLVWRKPSYFKNSDKPRLRTAPKVVDKVYRCLIDAGAMPEEAIDQKGPVPVLQHHHEQFQHLLQVCRQTLDRATNRQGRELIKRRKF